MTVTRAASLAQALDTDLSHLLHGTDLTGKADATFSVTGPERVIIERLRRMPTEQAAAFDALIRTLSAR